jgi:hypothetical protein
VRELYAARGSDARLGASATDADGADHTELMNGRALGFLVPPHPQEETV